MDVNGNEPSDSPLFALSSRSFDCFSLVFSNGGNCEKPWSDKKDIKILQVSPTRISRPGINSEMLSLFEGFDERISQEWMYEAMKNKRATSKL